MDMHKHMHMPHAHIPMLKGMSGAPLSSCMNMAAVQVTTMNALPSSSTNLATTCEMRCDAV